MCVCVLARVRAAPLPKFDDVYASDRRIRRRRAGRRAMVASVGGVEGGSASHMPAGKQRVLKGYAGGSHGVRMHGYSRGSDGVLPGYAGGARVRVREGSSGVREGYSQVLSRTGVTLLGLFMGSRSPLLTQLPARSMQPAAQVQDANMPAQCTVL